MMASSSTRTAYSYTTFTLTCPDYILLSANQGVTSMFAHAEATVFWLGITPAITALKANCNHCNSIAPLQHSAPPYPSVPPAYPLPVPSPYPTVLPAYPSSAPTTSICSTSIPLPVAADSFHYVQGNEVACCTAPLLQLVHHQAQEGSGDLNDCLPYACMFAMFRIPNECAMDGSPVYFLSSGKVATNKERLLY